MFQMVVPVLAVGLCDLLRPDNEEVFRILFLRGLCKVEGAGYCRQSVDNDDLVVGDGMPVIDVRRDPHVREECGGGVFRGALALVEDGRNFDAPLAGLDERFRDGGGCEGICLDEYLRSRRGDLPYDPVGTGTPGGEAEADVDILSILVCTRTRQP